MRFETRWRELEARTTHAPHAELAIARRSMEETTARLQSRGDGGSGDVRAVELEQVRNVLVARVEALETQL
eukprot:SAG11_NODE_3353_length_2506_cov_1.520980_1_plen_70_part_10